MSVSPSPRPLIAPPEAPVLVLGTRQAAWLTADGEIDTVPLPEVVRRLRHEAPLLVHARSVARRLNLRDWRCYDLLELFAFVLPGQFCLPTPRGLVAALGMAPPSSLEDQAIALVDAVPTLLERLMRQGSASLQDLVRQMEAGGWAWGPSAAAALGMAPGGRPRGIAGLDVWQRLPEWSEAGPIDPPTHYPVEPADARTRLAQLIHGTPRRAVLDEAPSAEARPQQADYASAVSAGFAPRQAPAEPNIVLAEAGTGVGKTLGYLAPASLWAERNGGTVWVSTYTRNLQAQIDGELDRLFPDPVEKAAKVVLRKGRENYLCLLNLEEASRAVGGRASDAIGLGIMARWALATKDGALVGGDLPGWLVDLLGRAQTLGLADRRGECVYSACPHYTKCFIEHSVRRARRARIVVANHALVMVQAALGGLDDTYLPLHYVFDEGHHVFDAADSAFAAHLSGLATSELRRWLLGAEEGGGRARGLRRRLEDLIADDEKALEDMQAVLVAAAVLPSEGWALRLVEEPRQAIERFLSVVRRQVLARAANLDSAYDLETDRHPLLDDMPEAAAAADRALAALEAPIKRLCAFLERSLDQDAEELETAQRQRIEAMTKSLERRIVIPVAAWRGMLADLGRATPETMVDWFSISRSEGRDVDVGLHRHWIDPTFPFAKAVLEPAHGAVITSATLTDAGEDAEAGWLAAEARTGAAHLLQPALRARVPSPFDYAAQTRAFVVTDVRKDDLDQVAAAYRELFLAAGGGGLGLFTAISRLKAVHERIAGPLDAAGVPLLAQHLDGLDVGTLIDIFRAEEDACLLGTDAVRDGVDVPGRSLRLICFDRVPWPRPDILHRARRAAFGGKLHDDRLVRLKLRQAFGRLIRRAGDTGVFVLLDPMMPSRLAGAFPEGVELRRVGLAEAIAETRRFLMPPDPV